MIPWTLRAMESPRRPSRRSPDRPEAAGRHERERDLALASTRIGRTASEQVRWLLAFAERDLDQVSSGERAALGDEVIAFTAGGQDAAASMYASNFERPTDNGLRRLQERIGAVLVALVAHQTGRVLETTEAAAKEGRLIDLGDALQLPAAPERLTAAPAPDDPDALVVGRSRGFTIADMIRDGSAVLAAVFEHRGADVLVASRPRPRRCKECGRLFAPRGRQLRHPRCSQRVRDRKRLRARKKKLKKGA